MSKKMLKKMARDASGLIKARRRRRIRIRIRRERKKKEKK